MKIKMNTSAHGPDFNANPGDVLEVGHNVTKETAITLLNGGYAVKIEDDAQIETAVAPKPEAPAVQVAANPAPKPEAKPAPKPAAKKGKGK